MSREIKFRAWYVDEFHYGIEKHHIEYDSTSNPCGEVWDFSDWLTYTKVQQYTGLKDKNGKEIYEGDIIIFDKQDGLWSDQVNRIIEVKYPFICDNAHLAKIIGNIVETPELLENMTNTILDRFDELVAENEKLKIELQEAKEYIDKLVEHKDMVCLPADLANLREANAQFAIENQKLRDKIIQLQKEF